MADTVDLLAVFPDLDPAANAIEHLRTLGIHDENMSVISGIPVTEAMLGRPSQWTNVPRIAFGGAVLGFCAGDDIHLTVGNAQIAQLVNRICSRPKVSKDR